MSETPRVTWREKIGVAILLAVLAFAFNWQFIPESTYAKLIITNDIPDILKGYGQVPHLFPDSLRWWHGTWIQVGIPAFRPLTAYLYWIECYIGMHFGFIWTAWLGYILFVIDCWLSAALAWRLTRSKLLMVFGGALATMLRLYNTLQNADWLKWFPGHQELFMLGFLLGAVLCVDVAVTEGRRRYFAYTALLFVLGSCAKEHVYIFPAMALVITLARRAQWDSIKRLGLLGSGLMFGWVGVLWVYRKAIIERPRTPELHAAKQLIAKPLCFMYTTFYRYTCTPGEPDYWMVGLAFLLFLLAGLTIRQRRQPLLPPKIGKVVHRPVLAIPLYLIIVIIYLQLVHHPLPELLWKLIDPLFMLADQFAHGSVKDAFHSLLSGGSSALPVDLADMVFIIYYTYLLIKYRRREPTAIAWWLLLLAYLPVLTFIGWHYTLPAWFFQSAYLALIAKLIWIDLGEPYKNILVGKVPGILGQTLLSVPNSEAVPEPRP